MDVRNKTTQNSGQFLTVPWVSLIPRFHCNIMMYFYFYSQVPLYIVSGLQIHLEEEGLTFQSHVSFSEKTNVSVTPSVLGQCQDNVV